MTRRPCQRIMLLLLAAAGLWSCGGGAGRDAVTSPPTSSFKPVLSWVKVSVSPLTLEVGATGTARAEAFDQNGGPFNPSEPFSYRTSASTVVTIDAAGTMRAIAPGTAVITVSLGGKEASKDVSVVPVAVARMVLSPSVLQLDPGASETCVATAYDALGGVLDGRPITWSISDTTVATVSAAGRVTARAAGLARITAASGDVSSSAIVTVTGADSASSQMLVMIGIPAPGEIVGDTLEVFASVRSSQPLARVEAHFQGVTIPMEERRVGFFGQGIIWYAMFNIEAVRFDTYYVMVSATDVNNAGAADSVLFERNPRKKGGVGANPEKKNKLVAPPALPRRPRGNLVGKP